MLGLPKQTWLRRMEWNWNGFNVLSDHQNQGLGEKLLAKVIDIARQRSFPFLWLGVWEKNQGAVRFYERHGFVHAAYHPFKLGDEDQTDWIMKLELASDR